MQSIHDQRPKVGVGVIILKNQKVLCGKRKSSHGEGTWSFPGGHLEFNESLVECAKRETLEETGVHIRNVRFSTVSNDKFIKEKKHYITVYMIAEYESGEVSVCEPEKCEKWEWFSWNELPQPQFLGLEALVKRNFDPVAALTKSEKIYE